MQVSNQLYGKLTTDGTKKLYVYRIIMAFDEVYNPVKKELWDRKAVSFGIITNEELPSEEVSVKTVQFTTEVHVFKHSFKVLLSVFFSCNDYLCTKILES